MRCQQYRWRDDTGWQPQLSTEDSDNTLVLIFGGREALTAGSGLSELHAALPDAVITGCSTAGEILGTTVTDEALHATVIRFAHSEVSLANSTIESSGDSRAAGTRLAGELTARPGLAHVLLFAVGTDVNGSDLVAGVQEGLPEGVTFSGGLAGDGARFEETRVVIGGTASARTIAAVGLYGDRLKVATGSMGGWDSFGPDRLITRSEGNVLYTLDNEPALELYRRYLGPHADELPASALLFPLNVRSPEDKPGSGLTRTILGIDREEGSLTFAGDVPEGHFARLMKTNIERLVDGAEGAATACLPDRRDESPELALLISCVGRKLVMKQRTEDEVEAVRALLGDDTTLTGFYSYGEISPHGEYGPCELHNQTMTITTFREA